MFMTSCPAVLFTQCVHQTRLDTSADVSRALLGRLTTALPTEPVTPSSVTRVDALMPFQLTASTVSQTPVKQVQPRTTNRAEVSLLTHQHTLRCASSRKQTSCYCSLKRI